MAAPVWKSRSSRRLVTMMLFVAASAAGIRVWQERRRFSAANDLVRGLGPVSQSLVLQPTEHDSNPVLWPGVGKFRSDWAEIAELKADRHTVEAIAAGLDRALLEDDPVVAGACLAALIEINPSTARTAIPSLMRVASGSVLVDHPTKKPPDQFAWLHAKLQAVHALGRLAQYDAARDALLLLLGGPGGSLKNHFVLRSALAELSYYQDPATRRRVVATLIRRIELYKILAKEPPGVAFAIGSLVDFEDDAIEALGPLLRRLGRPETDSKVRMEIYRVMKAITFYGIYQDSKDPQRRISAEQQARVIATLADSAALDPDTVARKQAISSYQSLRSFIILIRKREELLRRTTPTGDTQP